MAHPDDVAEIARRLRDYLRDHPDGRFAADARSYLEWWDKVSVPGEYRVTLRRGEVEPTVGKYLSGGAPDLGVVIEVAGVVHGPSSVIRDTHRPIWDYTFPRPIVWKLGDPITIRIIDYDWSASEVYTLNSRQGDPLAMRLLSGTIKPAKGGDDHAGLLVRLHDSHAEQTGVSQAGGWAGREAHGALSVRSSSFREPGVHSLFLSLLAAGFFTASTGFPLARGFPASSESISVVSFSRISGLNPTWADWTTPLASSRTSVGNASTSNALPIDPLGSRPTWPTGLPVRLIFFFSRVFSTSLRTSASSFGSVS